MVGFWGYRSGAVSITTVTGGSVGGVVVVCESLTSVTEAWVAQS